MKNRDQIAWALNWSGYNDREVAEIVADMLRAVGAAYLDSTDCERLARWFGLDCDLDNNWGVLEDDDDGLDTP